LGHLRIGLDVGGTFTDVVALDGETGSTSWFKVTTRTDSPTTGVIDAIGATGIDCRELESVRLGTTLGVNAILTHSGARTGLITTRGFRDVLEIRRTHRQTLFDLNEQFPTPMVPRDLRIGVTERVDAEGVVIEALDEDEVRAAWRTLRDAGVDAVAIVFLFSFENPAHERRAREIVLEEGGAKTVVISSDILPAYREYERTSTTVAAAKIADTVETYLATLADELEDRGLTRGRLSIMTNSGGSLSAATVARLPISTLLSGPVGGVEGARWLAEQEGWRDVLTLDMGGTSCDVSGIVGGIADERLDMWIGGHAISYPTYDIETIGAGGGSIAWIDSGGTLRVGPDSAGSMPGPACYGRGGTLPTVTDANLVLGRYDPGAKLGGIVELDPDLAREAIETHIAGRLGMTIEGAAAGIIRIVNILMTNAVRVISVERGRDVRDFTLVAYGGAGPAHAAEIARELSIPRVLIPPFPGCASAFGAAIAGSRRDLLHSVARVLDEVDVAALEARVQDLRSRAAEALEVEGFATEKQTLETWLDVRYRGQAHELGVRHKPEAVDRASLEAAAQDFHALHHQLYGHSFTDVPVELVNVRVKGFGRRPELEMWWDWSRGGAMEASLPPTRSVYFEEHGFLETRVLMRDTVRPGDVIEGPAVVHQADSTVLVPPGIGATALSGGSLMLARALDASVMTGRSEHSSVAA
jgi:N-methylhydantoinase A